MTKASAAPGGRSTGLGEPVSARPRNPRGQGSRLREDIIRAATAMIERTGSDQSVTLRSVAREIGISAPSIYAHFEDRDAIVEAVVLEAIAQLHESVASAVAAHDDPSKGCSPGAPPTSISAPANRRATTCSSTGPAPSPNPPDMTSPGHAG